MESGRELFGLHIPKQLESEKGGFDIRPKQVESWIASLPLGNMDETAKKIYASLAQTNRIIIHPVSRLGLLQQLQEPLQLCTEALKKQFLGQSYPLSRNSLRAVDKTMALFTEYANAYKIITVDLLGKKSLFNKNALLEGIFHSILALRNLLLTSYQIYAPEPAFLWHELHRLYQIAESRNLHNRGVKLGHRKKSIEDTYKEVLLLAISNPYHLRNQEIDLIHSRLQEWSEYISLYRTDSDITGNPEYAIILNSDAPPSHLNFLRTLDGNNTRFLDVSLLAQHLRTLIANSSDDGPAMPVGHDHPPGRALLKRLLANWETRKKRNFSRSNTQGFIDVSVGLNGTHFQIEEENRSELDQLLEAVEPIEEKKAEINPLDINHTEFSIEPIPGEAEGETYWDSTTDRRIKKRKPPAGKSDSNDIPAPDYAYNSLKTLNVSAGGYCLLWDHERTSNAQVGELIGIRDLKDDKNIWRIGVVRWMQYIRNQGVKFGIEILAPSASPVQAKILNRRTRRNQYEYSCLSLPEVRAMHNPATLLTPSFHYKVGDAIIVNDHGKLAHVQLTRLVENTGNYSRFQYSHINEEEDREFDRSLNEQSGEWFKFLN